MVAPRITGNSEGGVGIRRERGRGAKRWAGVFRGKLLSVEVELDTDDSDVIGGGGCYRHVTF